MIIRTPVLLLNVKINCYRKSVYGENLLNYFHLTSVNEAFPGKLWVLLRET